MPFSSQKDRTLSPLCSYCSTTEGQSRWMRLVSDIDVDSLDVIACSEATQRNCSCVANGSQFTRGGGKPDRWVRRTLTSQFIFTIASAFIGQVAFSRDLARFEKEGRNAYSRDQHKVWDNKDCLALIDAILHKLYRRRSQLPWQSPDPTAVY